MIERIEKNEKRMDEIKDSVEKLEKSLLDFKMSRKDLFLLKKYYGSRGWFQDKEDYENQKISVVKAGVLSEDGVWNLLEDVDDLLNEMKLLLEEYGKL